MTRTRSRHSSDVALQLLDDAAQEPEYHDLVTLGMWYRLGR